MTVVKFFTKKPKALEDMTEEERKKVEDKRKKKEEKLKAKEQKRILEAANPQKPKVTKGNEEQKKKKKTTAKAGPNEMTAEERMNEFIKNQFGN